MKKNDVKKMCLIAVLVVSMILPQMEVVHTHASTTAQIAGSENGAPGTSRSGTCPSDGMSHTKEIGRAVCSVCGERGKKSDTWFDREYHTDVDEYLQDVNGYWLSFGMSLDDFNAYIDQPNCGLNERPKETDNPNEKIIEYYVVEPFIILDYVYFSCCGRNYKIDTDKIRYAKI